MLLKKVWLCLFWLTAGITWPQLVTAQTNALVSNAPAEAALPASRVQQRAAVEQLFYGIYSGVHAGLGGALKSATIPADAVFPLLAGSSEMLGSSAWVDISLGYELARFLAIQTLYGINLTSSQRLDRVRAFNTFYAGVGVKLSWPLAERWALSLAPHIAYAYVNNLVDTPSSGAAVIATLGGEYFVHVRHFAVGVDAELTAPLHPSRIFVGLAPHVRYTF